VNPVTVSDSVTVSVSVSATVSESGVRRPDSGFRFPVSGSVHFSCLHG